jgi:hypothetical protein
MENELQTNTRSQSDNDFAFSIPTYGEPTLGDDTLNRDDSQLIKKNIGNTSVHSSSNTT